MSLLVLMKGAYSEKLKSATLDFTHIISSYRRM